MKKAKIVAQKKDKTENLPLTIIVFCDGDGLMRTNIL